MSHCLRGIKIITVQWSELKKHPKTLVRLVSLQSVIINVIAAIKRVLSSFYGFNMLVCMPYNVWACSQ